MGFRNDIENIIRTLPPPPVRQTFLFSATVSNAIRQIAKESLDKDFHYINCVGEEDSPVHAHIPQYVTALPNAGDQIAHLVRLIAQDQLLHPVSSKIILFSNTTKSTQLLSEALRACRAALPDSRTNILEIHSKKTQQQRNQVSDSFRRSNVGATVLVTSDVSARGVDYPDVTRVIQVGAPASSTQYIHRVGRTGRGRNTEGRGDLVLLPFENGFSKYCLAEVPIKPVHVEEVQKQVADLVEQYDANPQSFIRPGKTFEPPRGGFNDRFRNNSRPIATAPMPAFGKNLKERLDNMDETVKKCLQNVDEDTVKSASVAVLGFYTGISGDLRVNGSQIIDGVRDWISECFGVEPPPLSNEFKKKLGLLSGGGGGGGRPRQSGRGGYSQGGDRRDVSWRLGDSRKPAVWGGHGTSFKPRWSKDGEDGGYSSDRSDGSRRPRSYGDRGQLKSYGGGGGFSPRSTYGGNKDRVRDSSRPKRQSSGDEEW